MTMMNEIRKYNVEFENSMGHRRLISDKNCTIHEAFSYISKFLNEHSYRSSYQRLIFNIDPPYAMVDVGSHTEFFYINGLTETDYLLYLSSDQFRKEHL